MKREKLLDLLYCPPMPREREPFLWYYDGLWHLFVEDGVFQCCGCFSSLVFRRRVLCPLVDSNAPHQSAPEDLLWRETNSSLSIPQLLGLLQSTSCPTVVMNPWSLAWEEGRGSPSVSFLRFMSSFPLSTPWFR